MAGLARLLAMDPEMATIPAGRFVMGSTRFYPEEAPLRELTVDAFRLDRRPVTNRQFAAFVASTGYVTQAERARAGALVFVPSREPLPDHDWRRWWRLGRDANWRKPEGRATVYAGRLDHPVVAVTHEDAEAYAAWACKRLPTEAEWEYAAWAGVTDRDYAWGDEFMPEGRMMANTWLGRFPVVTSRRQQWGTTPVGSYPANGWGLRDMIGNVWEWTSDWYHASPGERSDCCAVPSWSATDSGTGGAHRVVKGGSFLCSPDYCARYRPAARQPQAIDTAAGHIGFRCAM